MIQTKKNCAETYQAQIRSVLEALSQWRILGISEVAREAPSCWALRTWSLSDCTRSIRTERGGRYAVIVCLPVTELSRNSECLIDIGGEDFRPAKGGGIYTPTSESTAIQPCLQPLSKPKPVHFAFTLAGHHGSPHVGRGEEGRDGCTRRRRSRQVRQCPVRREHTENHSGSDAVAVQPTPLIHNMAPHVQNGITTTTSRSPRRSRRVKTGRSGSMFNRLGTVRWIIAQHFELAM